MPIEHAKCQCPAHQEVFPGVREAIALRAFMRNLPEIIAEIDCIDSLVGRGRLLAIMADRIRSCEQLLRELRLYAIRKQYETMPSEFEKGYIPFPDPRAMRRLVVP